VINPVLAKFLEGGIEATALHNQFLRAAPADWFMAIGGHGDPCQIAGAIRGADLEQDTV
jgi:hypothetical protein